MPCTNVEIRVHKRVKLGHNKVKEDGAGKLAQITSIDGAVQARASKRDLMVIEGINYECQHKIEAQEGRDDLKRNKQERACAIGLFQRRYVHVRYIPHTFHCINPLEKYTLP